MLAGFLDAKEPDKDVQDKDQAQGLHADPDGEARSCEVKVSLWSQGRIGKHGDDYEDWPENLALDIAACVACKGEGVEATGCRYI